MKTYLEAYRERMNRNTEELKNLIKDLKEKDCNVFAPKEFARGENFTFFIVQKGQKQCTVSFGEVPYEWKIGASIKPSKEHGSGYRITSRPPEAGIYTADEVIENMKDYDDDINKFIKWHLNYLEEV